MRGGTALDDVGHGALLAGRYRLQERIRTGADGSLWRAVDETLDRPVSVRVVRPGHRYTADVIDAARRAVLVEDTRLVRVLDVGETAGSAFIVCEHLVGRTLAELLDDGPLAPDVARQMVGEAAEALQRASTRGLHHLRLSAESLVIAHDGGVKVLGTAVDAALAGIDHHDDPIGAARTDAVGLVRLLYAGLTGRWPEGDGRLGTAPPVTVRVDPPADLVAGVPNDLDTLCAVTLGPHEDGPTSPGKLAEQLAPWIPSGSTSPGTTPAPTGATAVSAVLPRDTAEPAVGRSPATVARTLTGGLALGTPVDPTDDWALLSRATPGQPADAEPEPLGPFIPPAPIARPPRDQTRFVLGVVAGLVVVGLILAVFSLRGLFGTDRSLAHPDLLPPPNTTGSTGSAAAPSPSGPGSSAAVPGSTDSQSAAGPAEITGILAIDPQGDGDENGSTADQAIDGVPSTTWRSARYQSASFGGLKQGLGLYLRFSVGTIGTVTVDMGGDDGAVELRTASGPGLEGSTVVATAQATGGKAVLTPSTPLTGGPLILWFTRLPRQNTGEYRLIVSEISVS